MMAMHNKHIIPEQIPHSFSIFEINDLNGDNQLIQKGTDIMKGILNQKMQLTDTE